MKVQEIGAAVLIYKAFDFSFWAAQGITESNVPPVVIFAVGMLIWLILTALIWAIATATARDGSPRNA